MERHQSEDLGIGCFVENSATEHQQTPIVICADLFLQKEFQREAKSSR